MRLTGRRGNWKAEHTSIERDRVNISNRWSGETQGRRKKQKKQQQQRGRQCELSERGASSTASPYSCVKCFTGKDWPDAWLASFAAVSPLRPMSWHYDNLYLFFSSLGAFAILSRHANLAAPHAGHLVDQGPLLLCAFICFIFFHSYNRA